MLYRTITKIAIKNSIVEPGEIIRGTRLNSKTTEALLRRGAIREIMAPPISIFPYLQQFTVRFRKAGVENLAQLMEGDAHEIAQKSRVAYAKVVDCQAKAEQWLTVPMPKNN